MTSFRKMKSFAIFVKWNCHEPVDLDFRSFNFPPRKFCCKLFVSKCILKRTWNNFQRFVRDYSPQKWENCRGNVPIRVELRIPKSNTNNRITISGTVFVTEVISGQIDVAIETNKCSLDMTNCEKMPNVNLKDMCSKLIDPLFASFFSRIQPPLKCPIAAQNYTLLESDLDLKVITFLPIDGFNIINSIKIVSIDNGGKKKKVIMCLNSETKIFKVRVKT